MQFAFPHARIAVNVATRADLLARVRQRLAAGESFTIATLNLDHLVKLRRSAAFQRAYAAQDFVVADGNPVVWLGRLAGTRLELMPGSDLVLPLAGAAAQSGRGVALLGATPETLERAAAALQAQVPGLEVAACLAPPYGLDPEGPAAAGYLDAVAASGAGLCFLALGAPKQEILAARGRARTPGMGYAAIGAGLDFLAGTQKRAPGWVRAIAMEWLWRLALDPGRLARRYAACAAILPGHILAAGRQRFRAAP